MSTEWRTWTDSRAAADRKLLSGWSHVLESCGVVTGSWAWLSAAGLQVDADSVCDQGHSASRLLDEAGADDELDTMPGGTPREPSEARLRQRCALVRACSSQALDSFEAHLAARLAYLASRLHPALVREWHRARRLPPAAASPEAGGGSGSTSNLYEALFTQLTAEGALDTTAATNAVLRALAVLLFGTPAAISSLSDASLQPVRMWLLTAATTRPLAAAVLTAMAAIRGSLLDILVVAARAGGTLSGADPDGTASPLTSGMAVRRAVSALRAASDAGGGPVSPVLDAAHVIGEVGLKCSSASGPASILATACDGPHLLILHLDGTLSKVGTGLQGTRHGALLGSCRAVQPASSDIAAMPNLHRVHHSCVALHGDVAYVRTPGMQGHAVFVAVHVPSMAVVGRVNADGQPRHPGDFTTDPGNALLAHFTPAPRVHQGPFLGGGAVVVVSDGTRVHFVTQAPGADGSAEQVVQVHSHDPGAKWALVATVALRMASPAASPPTPAHTQASWFAGNGLVGCLMPPDMASASAGHGALFTVRAFRLADGTQVPDTDAGLAPLQQCLLWPRPGKEPDVVTMQAFEAWRLLSFNNAWPHMSHQHAHPAALASAGFYFSPENIGGGVLRGESQAYCDRCMCYHCGLALVSWLPDDVPLVEHRRHTSECAHLTRRGQTMNVPMDAPKLALAWDLASGVLWATPATGSMSHAAEEPSVWATAWRTHLAPGQAVTHGRGSTVMREGDQSPTDALLCALEAHLDSLRPHAAQHLAAVLTGADVAAPRDEPASAAPFAIAPSAEAFATLASLLSDETMHVPIDTSRGRLLALLVRVTGLFIAHAVADGTTGTHVTALGLASPSAPESAGLVSTLTAVSLREALVTCCTLPGAVTTIACDAVCAGLPLLWPSGYEQAMLLTALCGCDETCALPPSLAAALLPKLARSSLLSQFLAAPDSNAMAATLSSVLLNQLVGRTIRLLCDAVPSAAALASTAPAASLVSRTEEADAAALLLCDSSRWAVCAETPEQHAKRLTSLLSAATELASAGVSSVSAGACPTRICRALRTSILCTLLPERLCIAAGAPGVCVAALPQLRSCMAALARLAHLLPRSAMQADMYAASKDAPHAVHATELVHAVGESVTVESAHPCEPHASWERTLRFPGATHVRVAFDSRCSLERGAGAVTLFAGAGGDRRPVGGTFTGGVHNPARSGSGWPHSPVRVPGDTVTLVFRCDSSGGREWGFRAVVEGMVAATSSADSVSWLSGLRRLAALCFGTACGGLCTTRCVAGSATPAAFLDSHSIVKLRRLVAAMEALRAVCPAHAGNEPVGAAAVDPEAALAACTLSLAGAVSAEPSTSVVPEAEQELLTVYSSKRLRILRSLCGHTPPPAHLAAGPAALQAAYAAGLHATLHISGLAQAFAVLDSGQPVGNALQACCATVFAKLDAFAMQLAIHRQQLLTATHHGDAAAAVADFFRRVVDNARIVGSLPAPASSPADASAVSAVADAAVALLLDTSADGHSQLRAAMHAAAQSVAGSVAGFTWGATAADILARGSPDGAVGLCNAVARALDVQQTSGMAALYGTVPRDALAHLATARSALLAAMLRLLPRGLDAAPSDGLDDTVAVGTAIGAMRVVAALRPVAVADVRLLREAHAFTVLCSLARHHIGRPVSAAGWAPPPFNVLSPTLAVVVCSTTLLHVLAANPGVSPDEMLGPVMDALVGVSQQYRHAAKEPAHDAATLSAVESTLSRLAVFAHVLCQAHACAHHNTTEVRAALLAAALEAPPCTARPLLRLFGHLAAHATPPAAPAALDPPLLAAAQACGGALLALCTADGAFFPPCQAYPYLSGADAEALQRRSGRQRHFALAVVSTTANELALALRVVAASDAASQTQHSLLEALTSAAQRVTDRLMSGQSLVDADNYHGYDDVSLACALLAMCGGAFARSACSPGMPAVAHGPPLPCPLAPKPLVGTCGDAGAPLQCVAVAREASGQMTVAARPSKLGLAALSRVDPERVTCTWPVQLPATAAITCGIATARLAAALSARLAAESNAEVAIFAIASRALCTLLTSQAASDVSAALLGSGETLQAMVAAALVPLPSGCHYTVDALQRMFMHDLHARLHCAVRPGSMSTGSPTQVDEAACSEAELWPAEEPMAESGHGEAPVPPAWPFPRSASAAAAPHGALVRLYRRPRTPPPDDSDEVPGLTPEAWDSDSSDEASIVAEMTAAPTGPASESGDEAAGGGDVTSAAQGQLNTRLVDGGNAPSGAYVLAGPPRSAVRVPMGNWPHWPHRPGEGQALNGVPQGESSRSAGSTARHGSRPAGYEAAHALGGPSAGAALDPGTALVHGTQAAFLWPEAPPAGWPRTVRLAANEDGELPRNQPVWVAGTGHAVLLAAHGGAAWVMTPHADTGQATVLWVPLSALGLCAWEDGHTRTPDVRHTPGAACTEHILPAPADAARTRAAYATLCARQAVAHAVRAALAAGAPASDVMQALCHEGEGGSQAATLRALLGAMSGVEPAMGPADPPCAAFTAMLQLATRLCAQDAATWAPVVGACVRDALDVARLAMPPGQVRLPLGGAALPRVVRVPGAAAMAVRVEGRCLLSGTMDESTARLSPLVKVSWGAGSRGKELTVRQALALEGLVLVGDQVVISQDGCADVHALLHQPADDAAASQAGSWTPGLEVIITPRGCRGYESDSSVLPLRAGLALAGLLATFAEAVAPDHPGGPRAVCEAAVRYGLDNKLEAGSWKLAAGKHEALRVVTRLMASCRIDEHAGRWWDSLWAPLPGEKALRAALECQLAAEWELPNALRASPPPCCAAFSAALADVAVTALQASGAGPQFRTPHLLPYTAATFIPPTGQQQVECSDRADGDKGVALARWDASISLGRPDTTAETYPMTQRLMYEAIMDCHESTPPCVGWTVLSDTPGSQRTAGLGMEEQQKEWAFCPGRHRLYTCGRNIVYGYPDGVSQEEGAGKALRQRHVGVAVTLVTSAPDADTAATLRFWHNGRDCGDAVTVQLAADERIVPAASVSGGCSVRFDLSGGTTIAKASGFEPLVPYADARRDPCEMCLEFVTLVRTLVTPGEAAPSAFVERACTAHLGSVPSSSAARPTLDQLRRACSLAVEGSAAWGSDALLHFSDAVALKLAPGVPYTGREDLRVALACVAQLSAMACPLLPLLDFSHPAAGLESQQLSVAACVSAVRDALFPWATAGYMRRLMHATATGDARLSLSLNRARAAAVAAGPGRASRGRAPGALFAQAFQTLRTQAPEALRQPERAWTVHLDGEGALDFGGPYYESVSALCAELQSCPDTDGAEGLPPPLLIPSPNGRSGLGLYQELWVPNPQASSHRCMQHLRLLGMLLGIALRTSTPLDMDLAPLVFRALAGAPLRDCDWAQVDAIQARDLVALEQSPAAPATGCDLPLLDGTVVHIAPGASPGDTATAVRHARNAQLSRQLAALRSGLACIVPEAVLHFLSPELLATLCCGRPDVDVTQLRARATYSGGMAETSPHVAFFWEALSGFSPAERRAFLRFACGRSRMPHDSVQPGTVNGRGLDIQLMSHAAGEVPDGFLPVAHTCFFSIELPAYSSAPVMRARLLYAISEGVAIDTDHVVRDARAWRDPETGE